MEFGNGELYIGGMRFGSFEEMDVVEEDSCDGDNDRVMGRLSDGATFEGSIDICKANRNALLSLFHGREVTNNWLKMHGGVMSRKSWAERKRRREH